MANRQAPKIVTKKHLARVERERRQNRVIVYTALATLVLVFGVILFGVLQETVLKQRQPVARVGNDVITTRQFQNQVRYTRYQLINNYNQYAQLAQFFGNDTSFTNYLTEIASSLQDPTTMGSDVLEQMIVDLVVRQEAKKRGISVSEAEVNEAMEAAFGFFPNGTQTPTVTPTEGFAGYPSPGPTQLALVTITPTPTITPNPTATATVEAAANATPEPTATAEVPTATATVDAGTATPEPTATAYTAEGYQTQIKDYLTSIELSAFTEKDLYRIIETQLLRTKLQEDVLAEMNLQPTGQKVWARHILVNDKAIADLVKGRLANGEDFATLVTEFSTDTGTKDNGGDLGWFGSGTMVQEFEDAAFALEVGQISDPVQTTNGWHIIQVLDKATLPLTTSEFEQLKSEKFTEWLTTLKEGSEITKYDIWSERVPTDPAFDPTALAQ